MEYSVKIERDGKLVPVGKLSETGFRYDSAYLAVPDAVPLSVSLPLQAQAFSLNATKCYFEGLLPEGFTRQSVAQWMHVSADDYLSILAGLGKECLGAIMVSAEEPAPEPDYRELTFDELRALAAEGATRSAKLVTESHLSLTGASGKAGVYFDEQSGKWFQPYGTAPSTHIVKQSHVRLNEIVINELLCQKTADKCGIAVPDCRILDAGGKDDSHILFATKRYDRTMEGSKRSIRSLPVPLRLHQEDFAQAMGIPSAGKYEPENGAYLKSMSDVLRRRSVNPLEDSLRLWDMVVFNFLIGNTDSHIKNHSLLYNSRLTGLRLAPAYDMVSTAVYEGCTRKLSMRIGEAATLDYVREDSFRAAAHEAGLGEKMAMKRLAAMVGQFEAALTETARELAEEGFASAGSLRDKILGAGGYGIL